MHVPGQDMTCVPSKGKAPQRVIVKRSTGQEKKYQDALKLDIDVNF